MSAWALGDDIGREDDPPSSPPSPRREREQRVPRLVRSMGNIHFVDIACGGARAGALSLA